MKYNLAFLLICGLIFPLTTYANYTYTCEELEGALNFNHNEEKDRYIYDIGSSYFSGGPIYSIRKRTSDNRIYIIPLTDAFSLDREDSYSMLAVPDHWCIHDGEFSILWDENLNCGCETVHNSRIETWENTDDSKKNLVGVISEKELYQLKSDRYLGSEHYVSNSAYGMSCHLNDAAIRFRFDYFENNPEDPLPPRLYIENNEIKSCTEEGHIYRVWTVCEPDLNIKTYFENYNEPVIVDGKNPYHFTSDDLTDCTVFAETDDPFQKIISYSTVNYSTLKSSTGTEQPVLKQSGINIIIEPSSDGWWSSSSVYRARKNDDDSYEVTTLLKPQIDEGVPPGKYIYFVTNHNCSDPEAECYNYAEITVEQTKENIEYPLPRNTARILNHELIPILTKKSLLSQDNLPSYNTFYNSCAILPGEILRRQIEPTEALPARITHYIDDNNLFINNCGEEILKVEKVLMECEDDRNDGSFSNSNKDKWEIGSGNRIDLTLINKEKENCYYNCLLSIYSNDDQRNIAFENYTNGTEPIKENVTISIETDGLEGVVYNQKYANVKIKIENKSCYDMKNPSITIPTYIYPSYDDFPSLEIEILQNSVKITDQTADLKLSKETEEKIINLSGILPKSGEITIQFKLKFNSEYDCYTGNGYLFNLWLKHENLQNMITINKWIKFYCGKSDDTEKDDESYSTTDAINSDNSSGCALTF